MLLLLMNLLFVFNAGAEECYTDASTELLMNCVGLRFSWLNDIFEDLANLLLFSAHLRCGTTHCPAHLSKYGCHCTFQNTPGENTDPLDRCCLLHRRCYEELKPHSCSRRFPTHTNYTCSSIQSMHCVTDSSDWCEEAFCKCDQDAIRCFANSSYQPAMQDNCPFAAEPVTVLPSSESFWNSSTLLPSNPSLPPNSGLPGHHVNSDGDSGTGVSAAWDTFKPEGRTVTKSTPQQLMSEDEDDEDEDDKDEDDKDEDDAIQLHLSQHDSSQEKDADGSMLLCLSSGCPEDLHTHGCYCGNKGRGTPVDDLDRCCFMHQCCLDRMRYLGCGQDRKLHAHISCENGRAYCMGATMCDRLQCVCDRLAAECMASAHFNTSIQSQCSGPRPLCLLRPLPPSSQTHTQTDTESSEESSEHTHINTQGRNTPSSADKDRHTHKHTHKQILQAEDKGEKR
ncbi:hypothetical protein ACEWY4_006164 [Coilia grayii]|uniref:Phospholipase A2-like central domain-containing protein n=1 Tax=Coilia grayii TaxID=363190 RepID=A0ABD1KCR0_9TELE